ncbi:MAG TPA: TonB-dependent receptor [Polyangiaceae bacterium]
MRRLLRVLPATLACALAVARAQAQPPPPGEVTPPVVLSHIDAVYPASAVPTSEHVDVVLAVTVDADGNVSKFDVLESGGPALDEAATTAVRQWKFRPAMRNGKPLASRIKVPFHFAPFAPPQDIVPRPQSVPIVPGNVVGGQSGGQGVTGPSPGSVGQAGETAVHAEAPEEVNVHGRAQAPSRGASDYHIDLGELARLPQQNASDLMKLAPGVFTTNEGGAGHAERIYMRGFDAREGLDVELSAGGVPINDPGNVHGNGYADTHFIIPELVEGLRVLEGPFDPRQGNFANAGSVDYELGLERRGLTGKYTVGSYGTERALLTWGPKDESAHTFGGAEVFTTDGFGTNRAARRASAMGQVEGKLGDKGSWRLIAQGYTTHFQTPGILREDDYRAGRVGFYDSYDTRQGGDASRWSVAGDVESRVGDVVLTQQVFGILRSMRLVEDFTGFALDPVRGDAVDLSVDVASVGARGAARLTKPALGQRQELEVGYYARGDQVSGSERRLDVTANNVPYATDADYTAKLGDIGVYADAGLRPLSWVTVRGGARAEVFSYDVLDQAQTPSARSSMANGATLPRASLILGPFDGFTLSGSVGRGIRSTDPMDVAAAKLPAVADAWEGGMQWTGGSRSVEIVARSTFFATHVSQNLQFSETSATNVDVGGTTRTGWDGSVRARGEWFDESASVLVVKARFDDSGLPLPFVPTSIARSHTSLFHDLPLRLAGEPVRGVVGLGLSYVGQRPLPDGTSSDPFGLLDASLALDWNVFELALAGTNLLDSRYRDSIFYDVSDFHRQPPGLAQTPVANFTAGAPRIVMLSLSATLGGT